MPMLVSMDEARWMVLGEACSDGLRTTEYVLPFISLYCYACVGYRIPDNLSVSIG